MTNEEPVEGKCNSTNTQDGGYCGQTAGMGTDHLGEGYCKHHGGNAGAPEGNDNAVGNSGGGAPEENTNAATHGLYVETNATYQQILSEDERQLVDDIFTDYLEEYEDLHGEATTGTEAELFRIAVSYSKHVHADNWAVEKPESLESGNATVDKETHYTEGGKKYHRYKETVVSAGQSRLSKDRRAWLKDLGLLDDPQSQTADAIGSLKEVWKDSAQGDS